MEEIEAALEKHEITHIDYIWDTEAEGWQMLAMYLQTEFQPPTAPPPGVKRHAPANEVSKSPEGKKEPARPVAKTSPALPSQSPDLKKFTASSFDQSFGISNESIWFLYKDKEKYGPYRFLEIVQILQEKKCEAADFVWKPGLSDWERIRNVPEFEPQILKKLANVKSLSGVPLETVFIKRAFPRVPYDSEVILHDDKQVVIGNATTISEGGAFVRVAKPTHQRGDRLKLHFSAAGVPVPFNCIAEVTQVCKTEPTGYCLKFIYLEEEDQDRIAKYARRENRAKEA